MWFCKRGAVLECETLVEHECMPVSTCTKVGADEGLATAHCITAHCPAGHTAALNRLTLRWA